MNTTLLRPSRLRGARFPLPVRCGELPATPPPEAPPRGSAPPPELPEPDGVPPKIHDPDPNESPLVEDPPSPPDPVLQHPGGRGRRPPRLH